MIGTDCRGIDFGLLEYWTAYRRMDHHLLGHDYAHQSLWGPWVRRM